MLILIMLLLLLLLLLLFAFHDLKFCLSSQLNALSCSRYSFEMPLQNINKSVISSPGQFYKPNLYSHLTDTACMSSVALGVVFIMLTLYFGCNHLLFLHINFVLLKKS